jgi:hypothetical protein
MKKFFLLLIIAILFVLSAAVPCFAQDERNYQTYYTSLDKEQTQVEFITKPMLKMHEPTAAFIVVQDVNTKRLYFITRTSDETKYVIAEGGLNARTFPNIMYDNVEKVLPYGSSVQLIGYGKGWAIINEDEKYLFCWDEYLSTSKPKEKETVVEIQEEPLYSAADLRYQGVIHWGGWRWTWYSQNVLPGGGLDIPGRYVDENGYVCDENNYICLASGTLSKGSIVDTPFGKKGKVYDCGCAADTLDVYTNF